MSRVLIALSILILALAPGQARADIFAAVNVAAPPPRTDLDVAIVNASLGTRVSLPSNVNTTAFEVHPSISSDGRRLLFQRFGGSDGTRLLLVDTSTGHSADLFGPTEIVANAIFNSAIEGDGTTVATGRRFRRLPFTSGDGFVPEVTLTDVRSFPTGPFPRAPLLIPIFPTGYGAPGRVLDVAFGGNDRFAAHLLPATGLGQLVLLQPGRSPAILSSTTADFGRPAMRADDSPSFVKMFFEHRSVSLGLLLNSNLGQATADPPFLGPTMSVFTPGLINTNANESQPALTRDGRYLAFVRHGSDGHDRLFVRDLSTQTFLNPNGVDLGLVATRGIGSVSLYERAVLTFSRITTTGVVTARLASASSVGILVQRIVGATIQNGVKQYELEPVGRVPLGFFPTGKLQTQWDLAVDGEPLPPGPYLVTLRAVEGTVVRELGEPQVLKIDKHGRAHMRGRDSQ